VREPERDAGQGQRAHLSAANGGSIDVRELTEPEQAVVDERLPLSRLDVAQTYLVAWDRDEPVGHAHLAWTGTKLGVPEIQDVYVLPERRRQGVGTELTRAAERLVAARGLRRLSIGTSVDNEGALRLYRRLGYGDSELPPQRVRGPITIRGVPVNVDDTLIYLVKELSS
jgi:ribosomal protein S18 acetylase RimI-like enzyme